MSLIDRIRRLTRRCEHAYEPDFSGSFTNDGEEILVCIDVCSKCGRSLARTS